MERLYFMFFVLFFIFLSFIEAEESNKIYLDEQCVFLNDGKIFFDTYSGSIQLKLISSDENGVYGLIEEKDWPYTYWTCPNYEAENSRTSFRCYKCGYPRPFNQ